MEDPALEALVSFDCQQVGEKRPRDRALRAVRRLTNINLGLEADRDNDDEEQDPHIGDSGPGYFYLDGLSDRAREQDPSKRRRVDPGLQKIPREDGRDWAPGQDSETFTPQYRAELFKRRDLLLQDPDFKFVEAVAGAAYTRVERLYDQDNLETAFVSTQALLTQQARIRQIELERARTVSAQAEELREKLAKARRVLEDVEPRARLTAEAQSLLRALELVNADIRRAVDARNLISELQELVRFFTENFGSRGAFVYQPQNYTTQYGADPQIRTYIRRRLQHMERELLPGARELKALMDRPDMTDTEQNDALSRSLFYIVARHMAEVHDEAAKAPGEGPSEPPADEPPSAPRRRPGWGLDAWRRLARDSSLVRVPFDDDNVAGLVRLARGRGREARTQAALVLETRLQAAERARQVAVNDQVAAGQSVGDFVAEHMPTQQYEDVEQAVGIVRRWIEAFEPSRQALQRAARDYEESLERLDRELAQLQQLRLPELPYEHRMQWALRPENSGRVELEPIVRFGMGKAWSVVKQFIPQTAAGGEKALQRSPETQDNYAQMVASFMALAMNRFQVKWLPQKHRKHALQDASQALLFLSQFRWDRSRQEFIRAQRTIGTQMAQAVSMVLGS